MSESGRSTRLSIEGTPNWTDLGAGWEHVLVKMLVHEDVNASRFAMFGQTKYPAGSTHPGHVHPRGEEVLYVISGSGIHTTGDETVEVTSGDVVFIPAGMWHKTSAAESDDLILLWFIGGGGSLDVVGYSEDG